MTSEFITRIAALHRSLAERPEYQRYVAAKTDADAVEGLLDYDTYRATDMLIEIAREVGDHVIASQKPTVIAEVLEQLIDRPVDWEGRKVRELESLKARLSFHGLSEDRAEEIIARQRN